MARHPARARTTRLAIIALAAVVAACVNRSPVAEPDRDPDATPRTTVPATSAPTSATTPDASGSTGSAHVTLTVATANTVTVDVTDASSTLIGARSGTPGDGASVEPYTVVVRNLSPTTLGLTWVGGPCDGADSLSIDGTRRRLLLVQPECPGDAIATDRILELEFSTPIDASDVEAFLQDGLDT
jgi:hypothetical protein